MSRIGWFLPVLAALGVALPGGASASGPPRSCDDVRHGHFQTHSILERGMGCHFAREMVSHIMLHSTGGLHAYRCTDYPLDHSARHWSCIGFVAGVHQTLTFTLYSTLVGAG